ERAEMNDAPILTAPEAFGEKLMIPTLGQKTVEDVTRFLNVPASKLIKTLLYLTGGQPVAVLLRGDQTVNEIKLKKIIGAADVTMADAATVEKLIGAPVGFAGPIGLSGVAIGADFSVPHL